MRTVLKDTREVCRYWANKIQSKGKASNGIYKISNGLLTLMRH